MTSSAAVRYIDTHEHSGTTAAPIMSGFDITAFERSLEGDSTGSPARDQQLRLERAVLHSLSARVTKGAGRRQLAKHGAIVVGVSASGWAAIFGMGALLLK